MLCLMFECDERGILATEGQAWSDEEIARAVGGDQNVTLDCVRAVLAKGVAGRNQSGAVYSRRMVRDQELRKNNAERQERHRVKVSSNGSNAPNNARVTPMSEDEGEDEDEVTVFSGKGVKGEGSDIDPPNGWPRTEAEAMERAGHVEPAVAAKSWLLARTRGWRDGKNVPIRCSFSSWIQLASKYDSERKATAPSHRSNGNGQPSGSSPMDKKLWKDELDRTEAEIKRIRDSYDSHQDMSLLDKSMISQLKTIRSELKEKLGFRV